MIVNPATIDAYIATKGLAPRLTDDQWQEIIQHITDTFGHKLWHRCRLIYQTDEPLGRYCTTFPESVPQPYRHIRYLEFLAPDSPQLQDLQRWLTDRGIEWRLCRDHSPETDQDDVVGLQVFGYD